MNTYKKILGLDLGVSSIGWAYVWHSEENPELNKVVDAGVRIIPLDTDSADEFSKGSPVSINRDRRIKRTQRKGYARRKLRKSSLKKVLEREGFHPESNLFQLSKIEIWALRSKAATEALSPQEFGRVLYHLNQKRGYNSSRPSNDEESGKSEYKDGLNSRLRALKETELTLGQYVFQQLTQDPHYRVRSNVQYREVYLEEFDRIWECQKKTSSYAEKLTDQLKRRIRDEIIFFQRPLKSSRHLVGKCELERKTIIVNGVEKQGGPSCSPLSSPFTQEIHLLQRINNLTLVFNKKKRALTLEEKRSIYLELQQKEKISKKDLLKNHLGIKEDFDQYSLGKQTDDKGLFGNKTLHALKKALKDCKEASTLIQFDYGISPFSTSNPEENQLQLPENSDWSQAQWNAYNLWHILYAIEDLNHKKEALLRQFSSYELDEATVEKLIQADFGADGFARISLKAMRKIMPYLASGMIYSDACEQAGYRHANYQTKEEAANKTLQDQLRLLEKNSLRQPVVEKILNQTIHLVNEILSAEASGMGRPDEIVVELARELQSNQKQRENAFKQNMRNNKEREEARKTIAEYGMAPTQKNITKYLLWKQFDKRSVYEPEVTISLSELFDGSYDVDHIIPQSRLFDDSFQNKVLAKRHINLAKSDLTGHDYMLTQSPERLKQYLAFVNDLKAKGKISYSKYRNLMAKEEDLANDPAYTQFIARQLNETRFITRQAKTLLEGVCRKVRVTNGSLTARLRHDWGWENVLAELATDRYIQAGLETELESFMVKDQIRMRAPGWSKRSDHRHHALDALAIAFTPQKLVQRLSTLNAKGAEATQWEKKRLSRIINEYQPLSTQQIEQVLQRIIISYKAGKKVAVWGKQVIRENGRKKIIQNRILVPKGSLHEESINGYIKRRTIRNVNLSEALSRIDQVIDQDVQQHLRAILEKAEHNLEVAATLLKKNPPKDSEDKKITKTKIRDWEQATVLKYKVESLKAKQIEDIVDEAAKKLLESRLQQFGGDEKKAFSNLANNPIWLNEEAQLRINSVRKYTNLEVVEGIRKDENGIPIGFVKPGSNHHIALYRNEKGELVESVCSFLKAVERKKYGLPALIKDVQAVWSQIENHPEDYPSTLINNLPDPSWQYAFSLQQNEIMVFDHTPEAIRQVLELDERQALIPFMFRCRKLSQTDYSFSHIYETSTEFNSEIKKLGKGKRITSTGSLKCTKVRINRLGQIVEIGESIGFEEA